MRESDFIKNDIINFTPSEVRKTGADLSDVDKRTIISIQKFREYIRRRVKLCHNGLTTGGHKAPEHDLGLAIDSYLVMADGPINIHLIFKGALVAGFRGIAIYWNGSCYSFHFDLRPVYAFWIGVKDEKKGITDWVWYPLLNDPAKIRL